MTKWRFRAFGVAHEDDSPDVEGITLDGGLDWTVRGAVSAESEEEAFGKVAEAVSDLGWYDCDGIDLDDFPAARQDPS